MNSSPASATNSRTIAAACRPWWHPGYLSLEPFSNLNKRIAAVNQAEIQEVNLMNYLAVFRFLGCETLGDIDQLIKENFDAAYQIACYQIGLTDLDIISSSLAPQDVCIAHMLRSDKGKEGLKKLLDEINGVSASNEAMAELLMEEVQGLPFIKMSKNNG